MTTEAKDLIDQFGESFVTERLSLHLTEARRARIDDVVASRMQGIHVAVEDPADPHNALAILRTAEAMGVFHMHAIGWPKKSSGIGITRGTQRWTHLHHYETLPSFLEKNRDYAVAGACVEQGVPLEELPADKPMILLFGNEHQGLSKQAKESCDHRFTIPMVGMVESFNLSVAAGITLYDLLRRRRAALDAASDLAAGDVDRLTAQYCIAALGIERSMHLLVRYKHDLESAK